MASGGYEGAPALGADRGGQTTGGTCRVGERHYRHAFTIQPSVTADQFAHGLGFHQEAVVSSRPTRRLAAQPASRSASSCCEAPAGEAGRRYDAATTGAGVAQARGTPTRGRGRRRGWRERLGGVVAQKSGRDNGSLVFRVTFAPRSAAGRRILVALVVVGGAGWLRSSNLAAMGEVREAAGSRVSIWCPPSRGSRRSASRVGFDGRDLRCLRADLVYGGTRTAASNPARTRSRVARPPIQGWAPPNGAADDGGDLGGCPARPARRPPHLVT